VERKGDEILEIFLERLIVNKSHTSRSAFFLRDKVVLYCTHESTTRISEVLAESFAYRPGDKVTSPTVTVTEERQSAGTMSHAVGETGTVE